MLSIPASVGRPLMKTMARGKRLRGTALDPFGRAEVRRVERALIEEYTEAVSLLITNLDAETYNEALATARLANEVRGYETIKLERVAFVRERLRRR